MSSFRKILFMSAIVTGVVILCGCANQRTEVQTGSTQTQSVSKTADNLAVLWTSGDPAVAHKVCFMYTHNAKKSGWFGQVQLIVWGPSSKLLAGDSELQAAIKAMLTDGVEIKACKACADSYGVSDQLSALGIEVKYMGMPLTVVLKSAEWEVITF